MSFKLLEKIFKKFNKIFSEMEENPVDLNLQMKKSTSLSPIESEDEEDIEIIEGSTSIDLEKKPSLCKIPSLEELKSENDRKRKAEQAYNKIIKEIHNHHYMIGEIKSKLKNLEVTAGNAQEIRKLTQALGRERLKIDSLETKAYMVHKRWVFSFFFKLRTALK